LDGGRGGVKLSETTTGVVCDADKTRTRTWTQTPCAQKKGNRLVRHSKNNKRRLRRPRKSVARVTTHLVELLFGELLL